MNEAGNTFKSVGTLRVEMSPNEESLFFSPNAEHSASGGDTAYAVFLPAGECTRALTIPLCGSPQGVQIVMQSGLPNLSDLVAAAAHQTAVEIRVKEDLTLESIVIPAPRTKR